MPIKRKLAHEAVKTPLPIPKHWQTSIDAVKAVQIAFDVSEQVLDAVRRTAFEANVSTSDQMRLVLGLPVVRQAKRPRLTMSLTEEDYRLLAAAFKLPASDRLAIKERSHIALAEFAAKYSREKTAAKSSASNHRTKRTS